MTNKTKRVGIALVAAFLLLFTTACSTVSTAPDETALHYKDGPLSSKKFADCVEPSDRQFNGPGDAHYTYPSGQRTYSFTGRKGAEAEPIGTKTLTTGVEVSVKGYVTFTLNTDCDTLKKFHEQIGIKYEAYTDEGWQKFLNDYLAVPLNSTMDKAGLAFDAQTLYSSAEAQGQFEEAVKTALPEALKAGSGSDFITINSVQIETPSLPQSLKDSLEAGEKAKIDNETQKNKNTTAITKYQTFADCKLVLSEESCLILKMAEDGLLPFYVIPQGSGLNLQGTPTQ